MRALAAALVTAAAVTACVIAAPACAETPEEWITLGARVHGAFGAYIPVGIRIGLDALQRLNAKPREVTILYYDSDKAPCACFADGIALATVATFGARTMRLAPDRAPDEAMAAIVVRNKKTGEAVKYIVSDAWLPKLSDWNRTLDPRGRYDEAMKAEGLFTVVPEK